MIKKRIYLLFTVLSLFIGCNEDDSNNETTNEKAEETGTDTGLTEEELNAEIYILIELAAKGAYIINKEGEEVYNFDLNYELGNDANLLEDGSLVASVRADSPEITIGGYGGKFIKQNADKTIDWEFEYSTENKISHHDVEYLSNGNILFLAWEKIENSEAKNEGFDGSVNIFPDTIVEMNPITQEIVWEWRMMDHLIQDFDNTKDNFGVVASNPNKIDLNYNKDRADGDISHANGLLLDEANDLIYVTANYYNEVWVIDHSTTVTEAATSNGGNYGLGGDLVYRFGNPETYDNFNREVIFNRIHGPNLLDSGNLLLYSNQETKEQSEAVEIKLPSSLSLADDYIAPEIVWKFTDPELFSNIMSNAERMRNGNTLVNEGRFGTLWEVTEEGEVVWQYETDPPEQWIWKAYLLYSSDPAFKALGIEQE